MGKISMNSKDIIQLRDNICKTKSKYWKIIKSENVMTKKAKKAGMGSGFDLFVLYNQITQLSDKLIKVKLMLNAINNGIKTFNFEEAKKTHYYTIYKACEQKELYVKWDDILKHSALNPATKSKLGKANSKIETFTAAKITSIKKKLQLEINKLDSEIQKFNDETTLEIEEDNDIKTLIAA